MPLVSVQKRDTNASTISGPALGRAVRLDHLPSLTGLGDWVQAFPALTRRATIVAPCGLGRLRDAASSGPPYRQNRAIRVGHPA